MDRATTTSIGGEDAINQIICGTVTSLSPFVIVADVAPPVIASITAMPSVLWPVSHKMVDVAIAAQVHDNSGVPPVTRIVNVTCNEPVNGPGDGNTEPDWLITGDLTVQLRAERSGSTSERVYTIHLECVDASGNSAAGTVNVTVPHDQGNVSLP